VEMIHGAKGGCEDLGKAALLCAILSLALAGCSSTPSSTLPAPTFTAKSGVSPEAFASLREQALSVVRAAFAGQEAIEHIYAAEVVADMGLLEFAPELRRLLKADRVPVRFAAAMALGDMKYLPARPAIDEALNDPDENVRMAAVYARVRLRLGSTLIKQVYEGLSNTDQTVRANAALVLGKLRDPAALTALYWAMSANDSSQDTRTQIAHSIALIGDEKIYPTIWTLLISSYANYRILGIEAMGALNDVQARNAIYTMLQDDVLDVRLAAAEQLGTMRDPSGEKVVLSYLREPSTAADAVERERRNVRAARAIGSIGTADLAAFLPGLLADRSATVRLAAAKSALQLSQ